MVASQELEPPTGWQYEWWLSPLVSKPSSTPEQLGEMVVESYQRLYSSGSWQDRSATLSATRISAIEDLAKSVTDLADALITSFTNGPRLAEIVAARQDCGHFAPMTTFRNTTLPTYSYVDLS